MREFAAPQLAGLIARCLPASEAEERLSSPASDEEMHEAQALIAWFCRRYPSAKARLAYARAKHDQLRRRAEQATCEPRSFLETAHLLARAHRVSDDTIVSIHLARDPAEREIRLIEVATSCPHADMLWPTSFSPRPDLGIGFATAVLVLSERQWRAVLDDELALPIGWDGSERIAL
jgi:hypothetical protein